MNLYSIQSQFVALDAMLEESQGVITPEIESYMATIELMSLAKLFDLQSLRDQAQSFAKICKDEADKYASRAKSLLSRDEVYKSWQVKIMDAAGQKTMENGAHKITLTQSPLKIEVVDETVIPPTYLVAEVKMTMADYEKIKSLVDVKSVKVVVDKKQIGEIYKTAGVEVRGVDYIREPNVRVS